MKPALLSKAAHLHSSGFPGILRTALPVSLALFSQYLGGFPTVYAQGGDPKPEAAVIAQHLGVSDPATEGWVLDDESNGGHVFAPVPKDLGTTDAWKIDTWTERHPGDGTYGFALSSTLVNSALSKGWSLRASVRIVDSSGDNSLQFRTGRRLWAINIGTDGSGDPVFGLYGEGPSVTVTGGAGLYHLIELRDEEGDGLADLWIDGSVAFTGFRGTGLGGFSSIWFGDHSQSSSSSANVNYALVEFEILGPPDMGGILNPKLTLTIDQDTGAMEIENTSDIAYTLLSYELTSAAGGLVPDAHDGFEEGGFGAKIMSTTTSFSDNANGGEGMVLDPGKRVTLAANGAWRKSIFKDAELVITFDAEPNVDVTPLVKYSGSNAIKGDLNLDGTVNTADFELFIDSFGTDLTGKSRLEGYFLGDMNDDQVFNHQDARELVSIWASAVVPDWEHSLAVLGNYAYVLAVYDRELGVDVGLRVIDISDAANPQEAGAVTFAKGVNRLKGRSRSGQSVVLSGHYAYVVAGDAGLQIIDVSEPNNPRHIGGIATNNARGVSVANNHAYVTHDNGLLVIDISDPGQPRRVGGIDIATARDVTVSGHYAYVANFAGLQVIDISDPTEPQHVGGIGISSGPNAVVVKGNYACVSGGIPDLQVIDISEPANPVLVGGYDNITAQAMAVVGNHAYVTDWPAGLQVIDISDPADPVRVGGYNTGSHTSGVAVSDNHAYVLDETGLQVIDIRDAPVSLALSPVVGDQKSFQIILSGPSGKFLRIQRSDNLLDWQDWQTITLGVQPTEVEDPDLATQPKRFYRAVEK